MQWNEEKPMNILIIGRKFEAISDVKTYTEMWAYNLACAFSEAGVTLQYHRPYSPGVESPEDYVEAVLTAATACSAKAILAPGLRYFYYGTRGNRHATVSPILWMGSPGI
ncbi:hypothetical protein KZ773_27625 [Escherichia coli]|nr:hypothetical protein [Escherichia coli]